MKAYYTNLAFQSMPPFFQTLEAKRYRLWSPWCIYWKSCSAIGTQSCLAGSETEATHRSLDALEKPLLFLIFDQSFEQKQGRFIRLQEHPWNLKSLMTTTILLITKKFICRSSLIYFKQVEQI